MNLVSTVLACLRENEMTAPGDDVTVAFSGGADSTALLAVLRTLRQELGITLRAAHFHHGLRGEEADRDEAFCRSLCAEWEIPLTVGRGDAAAYAAQTGQSLEAAARELRYRFLEQTAPGKIATAHNLDDNAETLLLHLLRGTGPRGLGGIPPTRGRLIRPLLGARREAILAYLAENGIPHVDDSSNAADDCLRNRLRHRVVPLLRAENPRFDEAAGRTMGLLRAEDRYLARLAASAAERCRIPDGYSVPALLELDPVLRRRILCAALEELGQENPSELRVRELEDLLRSPNPSACRDLPGGVRVCRSYDRLLLHPAAPAESLPPCPLKVPGTTVLPCGGGTISCFVTKSSDSCQKNLTIFAVKCDMITKRGWTARGRRPGDRLTLAGGTKTVKALMIDRKIPVSRRGRLPVLLLGDEVIAVFGLGLNPAFCAAPGDEALLFQYEASPDAGKRGKGE